jgi:hypothetical protein
MYYELLAEGNHEFVDSIDRIFPRYRTSRLDSVVTDLGTAQRDKSEANLRTLLDSMYRWRQTDPKEFRNRGGTNGVGYRLWMEAKQGLKNRFGLVYAQPDPTEPETYPGDTINGFYVPQGEGIGEICHGFSYRWAVAAGKINTEEVSAVTKLYFGHNGNNMLERLFPGGVNHYPPARVGIDVQIQTGDIIGIFENVSLVHSLIARTDVKWFGANNQGCFGLPLGRTKVNITKAEQGHWTNTVPEEQDEPAHRWTTPNRARLLVVYRRIP